MFSLSEFHIVRAGNKICTSQFLDLAPPTEAQKVSGCVCFVAFVTFFAKTPEERILLDGGPIDLQVMTSKQ